ncbi:hypothetical protein BJ165DRAFT_1498813 [Panaeolus papilionaceus]|nr:hypothetical protein BJ165DRAFT_1498813 [Panaeolus papilionaceus]
MAILAQWPPHRLKRKANLDQEPDANPNISPTPHGAPSCASRIKSLPSSPRNTSFIHIDQKTRPKSPTTSTINTRLLSETIQSPNQHTLKAQTLHICWVPDTQAMQRSNCRPMEHTGTEGGADFSRRVIEGVPGGGSQQSRVSQASFVYHSTDGLWEITSMDASLVSPRKWGIIGNCTIHKSWNRGVRRCVAYKNCII